MITSTTIEFVKVQVKSEDVQSAVISMAKREAELSNALEPNGIVNIKSDGYSGFIVLLEKKGK